MENDQSTPTDDSGDVEFVPAYQERNKALANIAARVHKNVEEELHEFNEETGELGKPLVEKQPVVEEQTEEEQEEKQEIVEAKPEPEAPKMRQLVVDGKQFQIEEEKVIEAGIRALQKDSAADRRLQEAVKKERQAQELLEQARQRLSQRDAEPNEDPQAPSQDVRQPAIDPDKLLDELEARKYVREAQKAAEWFVKEYQDIISDPVLRGLPGVMEDERIARANALGESFGNPFEAYKAHGDSIRARLLKTATPVNADKTEKKRTITAVSAASAKAPQPQEEKPKTPAETIEAMRKARTQGRALPH